MMQRCDQDPWHVERVSGSCQHGPASGTGMGVTLTQQRMGHTISSDNPETAVVVMP